ncbi:hypothetical protein ACJU26_08660 [Acidithiobacillus sp. M4-SHS-6]|uniref:hypothetical protein n=1 Tax=Acidithiobacillus sp. M4-SHS-6 TaxID=3383024 RepID=UPI0039BE1D1A
MSQGVWFGTNSEKVAENILGYFFHQVLGWPVSSLVWQVNRADLILTHRMRKYCIVEVKKPGQLASRRAFRKALAQGIGYAKKERVSKVAISDGTRLYAADIHQFGHTTRLWTRLDTVVPDEHQLWRLNFSGIRQDDFGDTQEDLVFPEDYFDIIDTDYWDEDILTLKGLPSWCFAYVGNPEDTRTWKFPYLTVHGEVDRIRLPKVVSALVSLYQGRKKPEIPVEALPSVYRILWNAVQAVDKVPGLENPVPPIYWQFLDVIKRLGLYHHESSGNQETLGTS